MTDPNAALVEALEHFLPLAKVAVDGELSRGGPLPLTPEMLAESVARLPAAREARALTSERAPCTHNTQALASGFRLG